MICGHDNDLKFDDALNENNTMRVLAYTGVNTISRIDAIKIIEHLERVFDVGVDKSMRPYQAIGRALRCPEPMPLTGPTILDLIDAGKLPDLMRALASISNMCVGEITMGYKLDANAVGEMIYKATGMNNFELHDHAKDVEAASSTDQTVSKP